MFLNAVKDGCFGRLSAPITCLINAISQFGPARGFLASRMRTVGTQGRSAPALHRTLRLIVSGKSTARKASDAGRLEKLTFGQC